jgi:phospholipase C
MIVRRDFLRATGAMAALAAFEPWRAGRALAATGARALSPARAAALPNPANAPFDHVIVLMMENRSFDHFFGWLPGANGKQAGLRYTDTGGKTYPTYLLADGPSAAGDWQGCGYADPDHSWEGGVKQLNGGRCDGFLKTAAPGDTFPIGYYSEADLPVFAPLAKTYTVSDNYFCSILAETYPNRFYQHSAQTDRDHNNSNTATMPAIWDRLTGGLTGTYYFTDLPFLALYGSKYASITKPFAQFLVDCQAGTLPNLAFVDPAFNGETQGVSTDDHPHGDIRSGEALLAQVYHAVRNSPQWGRTILVVNFDEWGGFYDHVPPPLTIDDHVDPAPGPHPDYRRLGFRVPNIVISPFSPAGAVVSGGAPFEHTSVLRMVEWRWGLQPLTKRDANARNLAEMLDFNLNRTDTPAIPSPTPVPAAPCSQASYPAHPPAAVQDAPAPSPPAPSPTAAANVGTTQFPNTSPGGFPTLGGAAIAVGGAVAVAALRPSPPPAQEQEVN